MWRLLTAALFLGFGLIAAQAQMRGGHAGPGFRGGPVAGFHGRSGAVVFRSQVPVRAYGPRWGAGFGFGFRGFHHHHFFRYRFGYPYAYYGYPAVYPYYYDPYMSGYSYSYDTTASYAQQQQQQYLSSQISELGAQIQQLREENRDLRYDLQNRQQATSSGPDRRIPESLPEPRPRETPATVFVFRDGHRAETRNYAIVGKTLWILSEQRSVRVPFSNLDVDKTKQENADRGVEFTVPSYY